MKFFGAESRVQVLTVLPSGDARVLYRDGGADWQKEVDPADRLSLRREAAQGNPEAPLGGPRDGAGFSQGSSPPGDRSAPGGHSAIASDHCEATRNLK